MRSSILNFTKINGEGGLPNDNLIILNLNRRSKFLKEILIMSYTKDIDLILDGNIFKACVCLDNQCFFVLEMSRLSAPLSMVRFVLG